MSNSEPLGKQDLDDEILGYKGEDLQRLKAEAEHITREEYNPKKVIVISALGTKQYYKRFGYHHDGSYMSKTLKPSTG